MLSPGSIPLPPGVELRAATPTSFAKILSRQAIEFVTQLQRAINQRRLALLADRQERQRRIDAGEPLQFLPETLTIRQDSTWHVAPTPPDLQKRWVEITGPTDRKMLINALNSGADVFMADFEDANSPTWENMLDGQMNLCSAVDRTIRFTSLDGKIYTLNPQTATLMVRPRGWHLEEKHLWVDGAPISASVFDFGMFFFHNAKKLIQAGSGPYFYLAKLEGHLEARLWNDVFILAQELMGLPIGTIRATVLVETILAAFEMEEILFELRQHAAGLNAGRWDYIFSTIKKFRNTPGFLLPERAQITMTVPFMRAYTELLVRTCHTRGAHAIGGMAAFIPSRKDKEINDKALSKVREDKLRESQDGFDGTWVAHPDLVPTARQVFQDQLGQQNHQKERIRQEVQITAQELTNFQIPAGQISEAGLRLNVNVAIQYIESWLRGVGAAAINNLMEDTATAEISRAQVWQWVHHPRAALDDGRKITKEMVCAMIPEELAKIKTLWGSDLFAASKIHLAAQLFEQLAIGDEFVEFLTLAAYEYI